MANKHPTGFMNERSLEYFIIPELIKTLTPLCKRAVPVFFWKTREGGKISSEVHSSKVVKIIAVFARRPKLVTGSMAIEGKLNHEIIRFAHKAQLFGIPTVAGFCAARSLFDLEKEFIHWLSPIEADPNGDTFFLEDKDTHRLIKFGGSPISTIPPELLAEHLLSKANGMSFDQGVKAMSELRRELTHFQFFPGFGSAYKPVYILIEL